MAVPVAYRLGTPVVNPTDQETQNTDVRPPTAGLLRVPGW